MSNPVEFRSPEENHKLGVHPSRLVAFESGMLTPNEMVILIQDMIEAKILPKINDRWLSIVVYYTDYIKLCHIPGARRTH